MDGDDYVYTGKTVAKAYRVYREDCNLDEVYDPQDPPKREVNYWGSVEKAHKSGLLSLQPKGKRDNHAASEFRDYDEGLHHRVHVEEVKNG